MRISTTLEHAEADGVSLERIGPALMRYCLSITGSPWEAEDLAQEACLKALPLLKGSIRHNNPLAYILTVARNTWTDQLRRKQLAAHSLKLLTASCEEQPPESTGSDVETALHILLEYLSPIQRAVYLLKEIYGFTAAETAEKLGTTPGAVKAALHRARAALEGTRQQLRLDQELILSGSAESDLAASSKRELLRAYVTAFRLDDVDGMLQLIRSELAGSGYAAAIVLNAAVKSIGASRGQSGDSLPSMLLCA